MRRFTAKTIAAGRGCNVTCVRNYVTSTRVCDTFKRSGQVTDGSRPATNTRKQTMTPRPPLTVSGC